MNRLRFATILSLVLAVSSVSLARPGSFGGRSGSFGGGRSSFSRSSGGSSFGRSGSFGGGRSYSGSSNSGGFFGRSRSSSSTVTTPNGSSFSRSGNSNSSFGRSGSFGGPRSYASTNSTAVTAPPVIYPANVRPQPVYYGGQSYNVYQSGGWNDYSYGWLHPSWYHYVPFYPGFYYNRPYYYGGSYYPGGFSWIRMIFGFGIIALIIGGVSRLFRAFSGGNRPRQVY